MDDLDQTLQKTDTLDPLLAEAERRLGHLEAVRLGPCKPDLGQREFRVQVDGLSNERLVVVEEPVVVPLLVEALGKLKEVRGKLGRVEVASACLRHGTPTEVSAETSTAASTEAAPTNDTTSASGSADAT